MMGVVVVDVGTVAGALPLEAAARAGEGRQAFFHRLAGDAQHVRGGGGGQSVENVVVTVDMKGHMGVFLAPDHHIKGRRTIYIAEVRGGAVGGMLQAKGEHRAIQTRHGVHGALVVGVGNDVARMGHQLRELVEGVLNVVEVLEEVQVVLLHIQNHRHRGIEAEEAVAVFAGLQDDGVAVAHPVAGMEQRQSAADHDCGVCLGGHENVGAHGSGRGLAVGTGDTQGVGIMLHDGAPGLSTLIDGDATGHRSGDFRVAVVHSGGADHEIAVTQVFGIVADGHGDTKRAEVLDCIALRHVRALDRQPHAPQNLRQGAHGHAADTHQVDTLAGHQIITNGMGIVHHEECSSFPKTLFAA